MDSTISTPAADGRLPAALTIAGSDPGGGAGVQADLRTFGRLGLYGLSVITAVTSQNTQAVIDVYPVPARVVADQLAAVFGDTRPVAVKTGMLPTREIVEVVVDCLKRRGPQTLVVDPVFRSSKGFSLVEESAFLKAVESLFPLCSLVTPNLDEAFVITGIKIASLGDARKAVKAIHSLGPGAVCITGGHQPGNPDDLFFDGDRFEIIKGKRIGGGADFHGTGCLFAAAAAGNMGLGMSALEAVTAARRLVEAAIRRALHPGRGMAVPWPEGALEP